MKLWHLFEQDFESDLQPGEKRERNEFRLRDYKAIENRIWELQNNIEKSEFLKSTYKQDAKLQAALTDLMQRLERKKEMLGKAMDRPSASVDRMVQVLETECSDFLQVWRKLNQDTWRHKWLYRGQRSSASVLEGRSRDDRKVKDSNSELSKILDNILEEMGFRALRSNSIFVTSSYSFAEAYGNHVYLIFPKNGFSFLSTRERDLVLENPTQIADQDMINNYLEDVKTWLSQERDKVPDNTHWVLELSDYLSWHSFTNVMKSIKKLDESGYAVPEGLKREVSEFITPHSVKETLDPQQTDLEEPMNSGYEIMINGSYWALRADQWVDVIHPKLMKSES